LTVTTDTPPETPLETLTDHELLVRLAKIADHLDPMVHEIHGLAMRAAPLLNRVPNFKSALNLGGKRRG
jgi:hypothetical protein